MMPLARAENSATEKRCLSREEISALATFKKHCDKCELDLVSMKKAYDALHESDSAVTPFWQSPYFIGGSAVAAYLLGLASGIAAR